MRGGTVSDVVLELFAGTCSFSKVAKNMKYRTITIDNNPQHPVDIVLSVFDIDVNWFKDIDIFILWASPPCTTFSVASIGTHWTGGKGMYIPKTSSCETGLKLLNKTLKLIEAIKPIYFVIENPRGLMRKFIPDDFYNSKRYTVSYCQYGDSRMKPTDIWTNIPWTPRPICKNGDKCHTPAPRGSKTGTQGLKNSILRSVVPEELCKEILLSISV